MDLVTNFFVSISANIATFFLGRKEGSDNSTAKQTGGSIDTGNNYGDINQVTTNIYGKEPSTGNSLKFEALTNDEIKRLARVVFVDDQDQTRAIKNLNKLGWGNVHQLAKGDSLNPDSISYRDADLIFVDYDGLGSVRHGQGLSILNSLLLTYKGRKYYILHTAHPQKITLQKLEENGLAIRENTGWSQLIKGSPDYLFNTVMLNGLRKIQN
jgi:hypothetical protein